MDSFEAVFYYDFRLVALSRLGDDVYHEQLAVCADAEGRPPKRYPSHDIGMCIAPFAVAVALLKDMVGEQVQRKDLATVRMSR